MWNSRTYFHAERPNYASTFSLAQHDELAVDDVTGATAVTGTEDFVTLVIDAIAKQPEKAATPEGSRPRLSRPAGER